VRGKCRARLADLTRDLLDLCSINVAFLCSTIRRVLRVPRRDLCDELLECTRVSWMQRFHVRAPVHPLLNECSIEQVLAKQDVGNRQQQACLSPGPRCEPVIGARSRVRQSHIDDAHLGAATLSFHNPLRMRIEVMPGLKMR